MSVQGETIAILVLRFVPCLMAVALKLLLLVLSMFETSKLTLLISSPTPILSLSAKFDFGFNMLLVADGDAMSWSL